MKDNQDICSIEKVTQGSVRILGMSSLLKVPEYISISSFTLSLGTQGLKRNLSRVFCFFVNRDVFFSRNAGFNLANATYVSLKSSYFHITPNRRVRSARVQANKEERVQEEENREASEYKKTYTTKLRKQL